LGGKMCSRWTISRRVYGKKSLVAFAVILCIPQIKEGYDIMKTENKCWINIISMLLIILIFCIISIVTLNFMYCVVGLGIAVILNFNIWRLVNK